MHDLVITGATVVDGTGAAPREVDVAVQGGVIAAVAEPGTLGPAGNGSTLTGMLVDARASLTSTRTTTARPPGTRC